MPKARRNSSRQGRPDLRDVEPSRELGAPEGVSPSGGFAQRPRSSGSMDAMQAFGKYVLVSKLASGGMAVTYRARLTGAAGVTKPVVIKKILPHFADDSHFTSMFIAEARIAAGLSHANIAQVFDFGEVNGEYYLAMEFVHGQPLSALLKRARTAGMVGLPIPLALLIGARMLEGLHYAHTRVGEDGRPLGIVHRDVSPENVMVGYEGEVKVVDFGIAKAAEVTGSKTAPGEVKGKYPYFSPEQARAQDDLDRRSDVFSAGLVIYEMLCGRRAYPGDFAPAMQRALKADFQRPSVLNPRISQELESVLLLGLAADRDRRFATAQQFADALSELLRQDSRASWPTALNHLMLHLFRKELETEGRTVEVPQSFLDALPSWMGEEPPAERPRRRNSNPAMKAPGEVIETRAAPKSYDERPTSPTNMPGWLMRARTSILKDGEEPPPSGAETLPPHAARAPSGDETLPPPPPARRYQPSAAQIAEEEAAAPQTEPGSRFAPAARPSVVPSPDDPAIRAKNQKTIVMLSVPLFLLAAVALVLAIVFKKPADQADGPTTRLWLTSKPTGATVVLDGKPIQGETPMIIRGVRLDETHTVVVTRGGYHAWTKRFTPTSPNPTGMISFHAELSPEEGTVVDPPESGTAAKPPDKAVPLQTATQDPGAQANAQPGNATKPPPAVKPEDKTPPKASFNEATYPTRVMVLRPQYNALPIGSYQTVSHEMTPGLTYQIWFEGSASLGAQGSVNSLAYYVEGVGPAKYSFGIIGRVPRAVPGGRRIHFFALDPDPSDNYGSLRINLEEKKWHTMQFIDFSAREHAIAARIEHQFVLKNLNPRSVYQLTARDDTPETKPGRDGRVGKALCVDVLGPPRYGLRSLRILEVGKRYNISGLDSMECTFPDELIADNAGAIEVDIVDVAAARAAKTTKRKQQLEEP